MALDILSLRCLLDIQVETSGRQLTMRVQFWKVVQVKYINLRVIICVWVGPSGQGKNYVLIIFEPPPNLGVACLPIIETQ